MKAKLVIECDDGEKMLPVGTEIDHPMCYRLVQNGTAEPADEECRIKANRTPEQMEKAQAAQRKLRKVGLQKEGNHG